MLGAFLSSISVIPTSLPEPTNSTLQVFGTALQVHIGPPGLVSLFCKIIMIKKKKKVDDYEIQGKKM